MEKDSIKRICLWSGPRNISTALMYSFAQRSDTKVVDEPLYAHYLNSTDAHSYHPGADDILSTMENDGNKVIKEMLGKHSKPIVFFKHMTHHLVNLDLSFLSKTINVILTRNPIDMLPSYDQAIKNPSMKDVGYKAHLDLIQKLEELGQKPIIIDSRSIQENPEIRLRDFCHKLNVPFDQAMLSWEAGPIKEDGCWAPYWYQNVHKSTGFIAYTPKTKAFPPHLRGLLEECIPIYQEITKRALET